MKDAEETFQKAIAWCRREYRKRFDHSAHCSIFACEVMREAEERFKLGTFGVEGWADEVGRSGVSYLNTGDTYARTIIFRSSDRNTGRWSLGAWGNIAEKQAS